MAHYTLLVKYEGTIEEAEERVERMLAPYGSEGGAPKIFIPRKELEKEFEGIKTDKSGKHSNGYIERVKEMGFEKWVKMAYSNYEVNDNFDVITTNNENYKWDYYGIGSGGKKEGSLKLLKERPSGHEYPPGKEKADIAYAKDVDLEGFRANAVLDKDGFHEPPYHTRLNHRYDKKELEDEIDTWAKTFRNRFLNDFSDRTVLVVVDLHI